MMPELFLKADALIRSGDLEKARDVQYDICKIIYAMCDCCGNLYAVMKEILRRKGMNVGGVRLPLAAITDADLPQITKCAAMIDDAISRNCK